MYDNQYGQQDLGGGGGGGMQGGMMGGGGGGMMGGMQGGAMQGGYDQQVLLLLATYWLLLCAYWLLLCLLASSVQSLHCPINTPCFLTALKSHAQCVGPPAAACKHRLITSCAVHSS
jgi:hypothetical protein